MANTATSAAIRGTPDSPFTRLDADIVISAVEDYLGLQLTGVITPYPSYVNRVFGLEDEDRNRFIVKFYRPGRWTPQAIAEEHRLIHQCSTAELPVVAPLPCSPDLPISHSYSPTLADCQGIPYTVFPLRSGRLFEAVQDQDWVRLGSLVGRLHAIGRSETAPERTLYLPQTIAGYVQGLLDENHVHPALASEFRQLCDTTLREISPLFKGVPLQRIHGDCHSGNILDRGSEGLLMIDFDDMMTGPAVQDLWLLLPDHVEASRMEFDMLLMGYEQFMPFDTRQMRLIEPLRFMRIIHFLAWCAMQKGDPVFAERFPDWGSEAFWIREVEDIRYQRERIAEADDALGFFFT